MCSDSDSSENSSVDVNDTVPDELLEVAKNVTLNLLPDVSKRRYTQTYNQFKEWRKSKNTASFKEEVLLAYFSELSKNLAPSSLWVRFSMLKATIQAYENVDIGKYQKLLAYLKKLNIGYRSKKAKVFTSTEVKRFIDEAPDYDYLVMKVVLIFGVMGACRREELTYLKRENVQDHETFLLVTIPKTKTGIERSFTVTGNFYETCKKYIDQRSKECVNVDRFFLLFRKGNFILQPIGINTIGNMPLEIARFLNLPDFERYTSHSLRRTSATLLVDAGADITTLKRHGGWKSNSVAEGYIENSISNKRKIGQQIEQSVSSSKRDHLGAEESKASTSTAITEKTPKRQKVHDNLSNKINFSPPPSPALSQNYNEPNNVVLCYL